MKLLLYTFCGTLLFGPAIMALALSNQEAYIPSDTSVIIIKENHSGVMSKLNMEKSISLAR